MVAELPWKMNATEPAALTYFLITQMIIWPGKKCYQSSCCVFFCESDVVPFCIALTQAQIDRGWINYGLSFRPGGFLLPGILKK